MIRLFWALKSGKTRERHAKTWRGRRFHFFSCSFSIQPTRLYRSLEQARLATTSSPGRFFLALEVGVVTASWASPRFGHPRLILLQCFEHPPVPSRDAQIPSVLVIPPQKNSGFHRKVENVLEMDSAKYKKSFPVS